MRQEGRHIDYYLHQARRDPVGSSVMPEAETRHLVRTLFGDDAGRQMAARIDRRVDGLPGLSGLRLMDRAIGRFQNLN